MKNKWKILLAVFIFFCLPFLQVIVHEGGHVLIAKSFGYEILSVQIGSGNIIAQIGKVSFGLIPFAGLTDMVIMDDFGYIPCYLGGVTATFIVFLILLGCGVKFKNDFLKVCGGYFFICSFTNLMTDGFTDGALIVQKSGINANYLNIFAWVGTAVAMIYCLIFMYKCIDKVMSQT